MCVVLGPGETAKLFCSDSAAIPALVVLKDHSFKGKGKISVFAIKYMAKRQRKSLRPPASSTCGLAMLFLQGSGLLSFYGAILSS